jgi:Uma2 family endonuclease
MTNSLKWTTRDLAVMSDDDGLKRYEIIDGELFVTRAPHIGHQGAVSRLHTMLGMWSFATELGEVFETPGLVFSPHDAVIPDLVWASNKCLANSIDDSGHFLAAPEVVVEVLSQGEQNQQRDREVKLKLYSIHGVQEYWILNWHLKTLEIYRRSEAQLRLIASLFVTDTLTSPLLPGFSAPLSKIFK